jgi:general secretion pathway protein G
VEILVVLVIMGLLISIVAPTVLNRADDARIQKAQADFKAIETALKIYRLDNYVYPSTEQGLEALVEPSELDPQPRNFKEGGYLAEVPIDPWGRPYLYLSPGENGESISTPSVPTASPAARVRMRISATGVATRADRCASRSGVSALSRCCWSCS